MIDFTSRKRKKILLNNKVGYTIWEKIQESKTFYEFFLLLSNNIFGLFKEQKT